MGTGAHVGTRAERAEQNGIGRTTQRWLDRLTRDRLDLLAQVQAGRLKPKTAARQAGIIKTLTPLEVALRLWAKMTQIERLAFLRSIKTT
jgi:hypothetical protein